MPTYQYACTNPEGRHEFEVVQSFTDAAVALCPTCEAPVRKVYGSVGVVFKGSGFYRTDSRSGSSTESAKTPAESSSAKESSSKESSSKESSKKESAPAGSSATGKTAAATSAPASSGSGSKAAGS